MKRAMLGLAAAGTVVTGASFADKINQPDVDPDQSVSHYEGLPIPQGDLISNTTGVLLVADLRNDGAVDVAIEAREKPLLRGIARCTADSINLSMEPLPDLTTVSFLGRQMFHVPEDFAKGDTALDKTSGICDGNQVSQNALSSQALPKFVIRQVANAGFLPDIG